MKLRVLCPTGIVLEQETDSLIVPGTDGEIGILNNHAQMLAVVGSGVARVKHPQGETKLKVEGGFLEVCENSVLLLAESAKTIN